MRDRHFMEDENELPYLVWESRDENDYHSSSRDYYSDNKETNEERLDRILKSIYISASRRKILKDKIISLLNAKDCTSLTVDMTGVGEYSFIFTRENEYVKTVDEFYYNVDFENNQRVFWDCYSCHDYDNLVKNLRFQNLVKRSGMEFVRCGGGYSTDYSMADDEFTFRDEIDLRVFFMAGSSERIYKLDLDRMELSEDYL